MQKTNFSQLVPDPSKYEYFNIFPNFKASVKRYIQMQSNDVEETFLVYALICMSSLGQKFA